MGPLTTKKAVDNINYSFYHMERLNRALRRGQEYFTYIATPQVKDEVAEIFAFAVRSDGHVQCVGSICEQFH